MPQFRVEFVLDQASGIAIVVLTGNGDEQAALDAVALGAQDYLIKGSANGDTIAYPLILGHGLRPATYALHARVTCPESTAGADARVLLGSRLLGTKDPPATAATVVEVGGSGVPTWMVAALASLTAVVGAGVGWLVRLRRGKT